MSRTWVLKGETVARRVLRRGSKKGLSRRAQKKHAFSESTTPFACTLLILKIG